MLAKICINHIQRRSCHSHRSHPRLHPTIKKLNDREIKNINAQINYNKWNEVIEETKKHTKLLEEYRNVLDYSMMNKS